MIAKTNYSLLFHWIRCITGYTFYGAGIITFLTFVLPPACILLVFRNTGSAFIGFIMRIYLAFLTRVFLPFLQIYTIKEISGFDAVKKSKGIIYIANHRGMLDGPFLLGILKNTSAVMKLKYTTGPPYSTLIKRLNFISLNQHSLKDIERAMILAKETLAKGKNLLLFPEGTRSASGKILPFKEFAFKVAKDKNIAIVPIVIYSDFALMSKPFKSFFPERKGTFILRCLSPVKPQQSESAGDLASRIRKIMMGEIAALENSRDNQPKG